MDLNDITLALDALRALQPGESVTYYEGFLQDDRDPSSGHKHPLHVQINALADEAYLGYYIGELELFQRRLGPPLSKKDGEVNQHTGVGPGFAYIATRRTIPGEDRRKKEDGYARAVKSVRRNSRAAPQGDSERSTDHQVLHSEDGASSGGDRVPAGVADESRG